MERFSAQLEQSVGQARRRWSVPGFAVGVLRDGEIATAADGVCELGQAEPVTPETLFRVASITTPFVATLAMTLVQGGLLDGGEPPAGSTVEATVSQLLSNQGGLETMWTPWFDRSDE